MLDTGIIRRIDELGRVVIPKEIRKKLRIKEGDPLEIYSNKKAAEIGTRLHDWAKRTIDLGIKQPKSKKTIYAYVNDAIGYLMHTEVVLYYSDRFFGTADAISFRKTNGRYCLRIHDLKTGKIAAHMEQLVIYAALFCLEYSIKPGEIDFELRIYQNDDILVHNPTTDEILHVMDRIMHLDKLLSKQDIEEG